MNTFIYVSNQASVESLTEYANFHFKNAKTVVEDSPLMLDWNKRVLNDVLAAAQKGDTIAVLDALNLARSHTQVLSFLEAALRKGVHIQFIKYGLVFKAEPVSDFFALIGLSREIENDFVSKRNLDAIMKRQEFGIVLGRPKGRKNKSLKLDKFKKDIMRYLELSISKASIAKLVDCHPQTLYDWIERNEISDKKPRRARTKKPVLA